MSFESKKNPVYVLGTGLSHHGSACLLKNGEICVAIEKERITRKKHDGDNDTAAIQYCLETEGIFLEDLSVVVQNSNFGFFEYGNDYFYGERLLGNTTNLPIITISHHLAHAYNAIGTMPYHSAAILVIDGCGSLMDESIDLENAIIPETVPKKIRHLYAEKDSFYLYENSKLTSIYKDFSPLGLYLKNYPMHPETTKDSIGGVYNAVSKYVFGDVMDTGKLMGLAPYGNPGVYNEKIFELREGRVFVNYDWMKNFKNPVRSPNSFKKDFQFFADIAYWVQKEIEQAILYVINARYPLVNVESLAYTGGVALNAVANARILEESSFKNLYLTPAAGDNGLAVGCAYYGWLEFLKKPHVLHNGNVFLGKSYSEIEVERDINSYLISSSMDYKNIAKQLFNILPECIDNRTNKGSKSYCIQFMLGSDNNYSILINRERPSIRPGYTDNPEYTIYCDVITLIRALSDKEYYVNSIFNKKIIETGSSHILFNFDSAKINEKIYKLIQDNKIAVNKVKYHRSNNIIRETAELLASGKVIGWFQGGSEFGPRALGHRSILADPSISFS